MNAPNGVRALFGNPVLLRTLIVAALAALANFIPSLASWTQAEGVIDGLTLAAIAWLGFDTNQRTTLTRDVALHRNQVGEGEGIFIARQDDLGTGGARTHDQGEEQ